MFKKYRAEINAILKLGWPIAIVQLLQMSMTFIDTVMVGYLGVESLGAMSIATTLYNQIWLFCYGTTSALSPLIAQSYGADSHKDIAIWLRHGLVVALGMSAAGICLLLFPGDVIRWLNQPPEVIPMATEYLKWLTLGLPAYLCFFCFRSLVEATSRARLTMWFMGFGAIANIVLDFWFIFGGWGIQPMGVAGAALATSLVQWLMFLGLLVCVLKHPFFRSLDLWQRGLRFRVATFKNMLKVGVPIGISILAELLFFGSCTLLMGTIGKVELAAHHIAFNAVAFAFMIPLGLSSAITIRVGQAAGRKKDKAVALVGNAGILLIATIMTAVMLVFMIAPHTVLKLYTEDRELLALASTLLVVGGVFQIFDGIQLALIACLRGLKDTQRPMLNALFGFWVVGLPLGYFLTFHASAGPVGLWYGMVTALAVAAALHAHRWHSLRHQFKS